MSQAFLGLIKEAAASMAAGHSADFEVGWWGGTTNMGYLMDCMALLPQVIMSYCDRVEQAYKACVDQGIVVQSVGVTPEQRASNIKTLIGELRGKGIDPIGFRVPLATFVPGPTDIVAENPGDLAAVATLAWIRCDRSPNASLSLGQEFAKHETTHRAVYVGDGIDATLGMNFGMIAIGDGTVIDPGGFCRPVGESVSLGALVRSPNAVPDPSQSDSVFSYLYPLLFGEK